MGIELMKEYVGIAVKGCQRLASRHPLLAFMTLVLIWIYRSFPSLFALLVDASPVIVSTTVLLGILLFFGHSDAPEIQKEAKPYHHKIHNLKFGVIGDAESDWRGERPERRAKTSRKKTSVVHRVNVNDNHHMVETDKLGSSIDKKFKQEAKSGVGNQKEKFGLVNRCADQFQPLEAKEGPHKYEDDKGWETGSELAESTSPTASMADIFTLYDDLHSHHDHPQHAYMSNRSTHAESCNSEENYHGDIHVKEDEEKEEEEKKKKKNVMNPFDLPNHSNENIIESAPSASMARRSPSDISNNSSRHESDPVDSEPSKPNNQLSHHHERFDEVRSTLMASNQGKQGYNLETPDGTKVSFMHREMDELSDSNMSSKPDTEPVGFPLTKNNPSREADSTSIKESFYTESVASSRYEDDPQEDDLISVKEGNNYDSNFVKKGVYTESVALSRYEDDPREDDLISVKEGNYEDDSTSFKIGVYPESVGSSRYEDDPQEDDLISVKEGLYSQSIGSSRYEDDHPSRDADLISVKEGYYEDDSTSMKDGNYAESVASFYTEDDPSREVDTNSVKEGYYASEMSDYVSQRSGSSDDDDTMKLHYNGRPDEVKTNDGYESGYQSKCRSETSLSPLSEVTDRVDDDEDDYRSAIMPLASHSKDQKIQEQGKETSLNTNTATTAAAVGSSVHDIASDSDHKQEDQIPKSEHDDADSSVHDSKSDSTVSKPNEGLLPQRFSQVQQGLTSWFKWKG